MATAATQSVRTVSPPSSTRPSRASPPPHSSNSASIPATSIQRSTPSPQPHTPTIPPPATAGSKPPFTRRLSQRLSHANAALHSHVSSISIWIQFPIALGLTIYFGRAAFLSLELARVTNDRDAAAASAADTAADDARRANRLALLALCLDHKDEALPLCEGMEAWEAFQVELAREVWPPVPGSWGGGAPEMKMVGGGIAESEVFLAAVWAAGAVVVLGVVLSFMGMRKRAPAREGPGAV
ncbi:hypothetical protein EDC01DRAFT_320931 [Geopyxis carbonaria]|nr:hypothetical protein EDC01DRAFT_320931 [Geopyxis carbonaria]